MKRILLQVVLISICMTQLQGQVAAQLAQQKATPVRKLGRAILWKHWFCGLRDRFNGWRMIRNKTWDANVEAGHEADKWSGVIAADVSSKVRNRTSKAIHPDYLASALLDHSYRQEIFNAAADRSNEEKTVDRAMMEMALKLDQNIVVASVLHDAIKHEDTATMQLLFAYGMKPDDTHVTFAKTKVEEVTADLKKLEQTKTRAINTTGYKTLMNKIKKTQADLLNKQRILEILNAVLAI